MRNTLIVIVGPTGIGKTDLSIKTAEQFQTEIISADSRQIYKELQIGTATPDSQQLHTVKHHFIKSHSIHDYYNASMYEQEVLSFLNNAFKLNHVYVLTGGSMLYIDSLCNGIDDLPKIDDTIRKDIIDKYNKYGLENLRHELKNIDPEYYDEVDLKNHSRIIRALEVFYMTGKKFSSFRTKPKKQRDFEIVKIGLNTDRAVLHERINNRVDQMIEQGLVEEAKTVYPFKNLNSLNTVGYKELFSYFDNEITLDKAIELIKRNSRRYARRQLTWFRKDEDITWFDITQTDDALAFLKTKIYS